MNKADYMNHLQTALEGLPGVVQEKLLGEYE